MTKRMRKEVSTNDVRTIKESEKFFENIKRDLGFNDSDVRYFGISYQNAIINLHNGERYFLSVLSNKLSYDSNQITTANPWAINAGPKNYYQYNYKKFISDVKNKLIVGEVKLTR